MSIQSPADFANVVMAVFATTPRTEHRMMVQIIEAAVKVYARDGYAKSNFCEIAKKCGISRALVHYYFKGHEELFEKTVVLMRYRYQEYVIQKMRTAKNDASSQLDRYLHGTLEFIVKNPSHRKVLLLFWQRCSKRGKLREINTELSETGCNRVRAILELGNAQKHWKIENTKESGFRIYTMIIGAVAALSTYDTMETVESYKKRILEMTALESSIETPLNTAAT